MPALRFLTDADRAFLKDGLRLLGIPVRGVRKFAVSTRVTVKDEANPDTDQFRRTVVQFLNENGFRHMDGQPYNTMSFNKPGEIFIHRRLLSE